MSLSTVPTEAAHVKVRVSPSSQLARLLGVGVRVTGPGLTAVCDDMQWLLSIIVFCVRASHHLHYQGKGHSLAYGPSLGKLRERERGGGVEREREREGEGWRETDRQTDKQTETDCIMP